MTTTDIELVRLLNIKVVPEFFSKLLLFEDRQHIPVRQLPRCTVEEIDRFSRKFPPSRRPNINVSVLTSKNSLVYLLGVNKSDDNDEKHLADIIQYVKPRVVFLESCAERACDRHKDSNDNPFQTPPSKLTTTVDTYRHLRRMIKRVGFLAAYLHYANSLSEKYNSDKKNLWLDYHRSELIKSLMTMELKQNSDYDVVVGDRPIDQTLKRATKSLKCRDKAKLVSYVTLALLLKPFRKRLVLSVTDSLWKNENLKNTLFLERQIYLTHNLQTIARKSSSPRPDDEEEEEERRNDDNYKIIAIVSEVHMKAIQALWGIVTNDAVDAMLHSEI